MLLFLIPLKSAQVCNSWENTCRLLTRSLQSICNQTSAEFQALVICHEQPGLSFEHPAIHFLPVSFPPPSPIDYQADFPMRAARKDKHSKILSGILRADQLSPSHIMLMDADDLVSNQLADFVERHSEHPGWYFNTGFEYFEGSDKSFFIKNRFFGKCGSSHIIRYDIAKQIAQTTTLETISPRFLHHQDVQKFVEAQGAKLSPLPFPGAVYITNHGDNLWATKDILLKRYGTSPRAFLTLTSRTLLKSLVSRKARPEFTQEFGLYSLSGAT